MDDTIKSLTKVNKTNVLGWLTILSSLYSLYTGGTDATTAANDVGSTLTGMGVSVNTDTVAIMGLVFGPAVLFIRHAIQKVEDKIEAAVGEIKKAKVDQGKDSSGSDATG